MARVQFQKVWKKYGSCEAVKDLTVECPNAEITVLLGPSGAGKTSTLKMIAGLEEVTQGEILFDDVIVNELEPAERNVAMVFENYSLYPHWSVYQNLASPLRVQGMSGHSIDQKVRAMAALLEIETLLDRKPSQLSGGQQQRVSLGRALIRDANIYLLDEPIAHLDAKLRHAMRGELKQMYQERVRTFIYATHDYLEALGLGHQVIVLNQGELQQIGRPADIFKRPANQFVAFIAGEPPINFIDCEIEIENRIGYAVFPGGRVRLPDHLKTLLARRRQNAKLVLGIRPSHISLVAETETEDCVHGKVYVIEHLGASTVLTVNLGVPRVKVLLSEYMALKTGELVHLRFSTEQIMLFDRSTGANLFYL